MFKINETVWLDAVDTRVEINETEPQVLSAVVVGGRTSSDSKPGHWVLAANGTESWRPESSMFRTREEAQAAWKAAVVESQRRADAMPPYETTAPVVGDDLLDRLIAAAWQHGHDVCASNEGYGGYPSQAEGDVIRDLARRELELRK